MATPASGTITALQLRDEITRGAGALNMNEVRIRYGVPSGAISFNDLYACEGWQQTNAYQATKFVSTTGWNYSGPTTCGSVNPNEGGQHLIISASGAGSQIWGLYRIDGGSANALVQIANTTNNLGVPTSGYAGTDCTRIVCANVNQTIANTSQNGVGTNYPVANTGTIHCLIKF
jgi:hypothetical protein